MAPPSRGQTGWIADARLRALIETLEDRCSNLETELATTRAQALLVQSPINAQAQRVTNAADPRADSDLVTLSFLRGYTNAVVAQRAKLIPKPAGPSDGDNATGDSTLPVPPGGGTPPGGGGGGGGSSCTTTTRQLPNYLATIIEVAAANPAALANSCVAGNWQFMELAVAALRSSDDRFGYNAKRGNLNDASRDAVAYHFGDDVPREGSPNVFIVDIIAGHCGPNPKPSWNDVTNYATLGCGGGRYLTNHT